MIRLLRFSDYKKCNVEAFGKFMQYPTLLSFRCQKTIHNILWYFFTNEFEFLATATGFTQRNNSKPFNHATKSIDVYCVQQNILIDHQIKEKQRWKVSKALLSLSIFLQVNLCHKLLFLLNMRRTCCVQKLFWMSETIYVQNMFSPGLSLEFSCIELVIQWTICCHIVG